MFSTRSRSSVTASKARAPRLYFGGFPAQTSIQPSGTSYRPKRLFCSSSSNAGISVSDTQLISSKKRMPDAQPVSSRTRQISAMISDIV